MNENMTQLRNTIGTYIALAMQGSLPSLEREEGQTLAEYALILALIAVVVIAAVIVLQGKISGIFNSVGSQI
jgi:pilus assembly protein Flp/PilA